MNNFKWISALLLSISFSTGLLADKLSAEIASISYNNRVIILNGAQYYIPKKVKLNDGPRVKFDIKSLRRGMLVSIDYRDSNAKRRQVSAINLVIH
jgi:hypothetical protein